MPDHNDDSSISEPPVASIRGNDRLRNVVCLLLLLAVLVLLGLVLQVNTLDEIKEKESQDIHMGALRHPTNDSANPAAARRISLILRLQGGMGNQLGELAGARVTQLLGLAATPPIHIEIIGQINNDEKGMKSRDDLVHCFPEFRSVHFDGGVNDADFLPVQKLQEEWLSEEEQAKLLNVRDLSFLLELLERQASGDGPQVMPTNSTMYSLPYLRAEGFGGMFNWALEREDLYHDFRHWFRFDEAACCNQVPESDEVVYHHRNFLAEIGALSRGNAYTEVTPKTAARDLFQNAYFNNDTSRRSRLAIVSFFIQGLQPYVDALQQEQGISARLVAGQSGVQDFCFITKARTELVCSFQSTFCRWASLLSNATVVRYYTLDQSKQANTLFNSTSRKRIIKVQNDYDRSFILEQYWQPDEQNVTVSGNGETEHSNASDVKTTHEELVSQNHTRNTSSSSLYFCPDALYANGKWEGDTWIVDDQEHCRLENFTKYEFCRALGSRNILIIGDSINGQLFDVLGHLLGVTDLKQMKLVIMRGKSRAVHTVASVCGSSKLTFVRNDRLLVESDMVEEDSYTNSTSLQKSLFESLAPFHEIFILNAGAHYTSSNTYAQDMEKLRQVLEPYRSKRTILFRTTPRGHLNCSSTDSIIPSTNSTKWQYFFPTGEHPDQRYTQYGYNLFPQYNEIMRTQMKGVGTVLEVALQVELRPDRHLAPPGDCLHYSNSKGIHPAFSEWCRLILNAVKGQLG